MAKLIDLNGLTHVYSIIKGMLADKLGKNDTVAAAIKDGAGNIIVDTYANKTDISGMVKSVNGTAPDASGNVNVEEYTHPNSGVTAGTYRSVTVNAQGHVTDASNPTLPISQGGTGATTTIDASKNLMKDGFELIPENTELNNYKTPGLYICKANSIVATLSNCPTGTAFIMKITGDTSNWIKQELSLYNSVSIYTRDYHTWDQSGWSSWQGFWIA